MEGFKGVSISIIIFILCIAAPPLFSGTGVMMPDTDSIISQSRQRILIEFNGEEEVIVLSNVLSGNKNERVVRFIPLPAKPEVSMVDEAIFADTAKVLELYNDQIVSCYNSGNKLDEVSVYQPVQYPQNKPENISIFEVNDIHHFVGLLSEYIATGNLSLQLSPSDEEVIADYIERGFRFFILDTVTVYQEEQLIQPVVYKFKTERLIYPLVTLNSFKNEGNLEIYVFSSQRKIADDISLYLPLCRNCDEVYACEIANGEWNRFPAILSTFFSILPIFLN